jgi:hypothetical protein
LVRGRRADPLATRTPPPVPRAPEGWRTGPPDFVGVGTMKSGTSWWYTLLVRHPGAVDVAGRPKEVHFFDRFANEEPSASDAEAYASYFPRPEGRLVGEWTPRYAHDYWTPPLLRRVAPDARLLVLLRDPVDRFVSGVTHDVRRGRPDVNLLLQDHFARGVYAEQLDRLLASFERDRVLVLQYERCVRDTAAQLVRTYEFLGLDAAFVPDGVDRRVNATSTDKASVAPAGLERLAAAYRPSVARLAAEWPEIDLDLWPNVAPR